MPGPLSSKAGPSNTRAYLSDLIDSYRAARKAEDAARIELEIRAYLEDQPNHQGIYNKLIIEKEVTSDHPQLRALATNGPVQYYNHGFAATVAAGAAAGGKRRSQKTRKHSKKGKKAKKGTRSQRGSGLYGNFQRALGLKPKKGEGAVNGLVKTLQGEGGVALASELSRITEELKAIKERGEGTLQLSPEVAQALIQVQGAMVSWKSMSAEEKKKMLEEAAVKAHWQGRVTNAGAVGRNKQSRVANYLSKPGNFKRTNSVAIKQQEIFDQIMSQVEGYEPIEIPQAGGAIGDDPVSRYVSVRLEGVKLRLFLFLYGVFLIVLRTAMLTAYYGGYAFVLFLSIAFMFAAAEGSGPSDPLVSVGQTMLVASGVSTLTSSMLQEPRKSDSILPTYRDALELMGILSSRQRAVTTETVTTETVPPIPPPFKTATPWRLIGPDTDGLYWYENIVTKQTQWDPPMQGWKIKGPITDRADPEFGKYWYENILKEQTQWDPPMPY